MITNKVAFFSLLTEIPFCSHCACVTNCSREMLKSNNNIPTKE